LHAVIRLCYHCPYIEATFQRGFPIFEQGSFDHLCGVYSLLNGLAVMSNEQIDCDDLFAAIVRRIGGHLPAVLVHGMTAREVEEYVLRPAVGYCLRHGFTLRYCTARHTCCLALFWSQLHQHLAQYGSGSVLLSIWGTYNHWSCVKKVTEQSIVLLDSMKMSRIQRSAISFDTSKRHQLCPRSTYLLTLDNGCDR
jgi:hypothetical protein